MSYIMGIDITATGTTVDFQLGQIGQTSDGKLYKYVQYVVGAGSVAAVSGYVVGYYAASGASAGQTTIVTADVSDTARILLDSGNWPSNINNCFNSRC